MSITDTASHKVLALAIDIDRSFNSQELITDISSIVIRNPIAKKYRQKHSAIVQIPLTPDS